MLEVSDDRVPKSLATLKRYEREHNWSLRLSQLLAKGSKQEVSSIAAASQVRFAKLARLEEAIFDALMPTKDSTTGELEWKLKPEKFESTLQTFLKLVDRIEVMSGGVTSRSEVKTVVNVNVQIVAMTIGRVLNETLRDGLITTKVAQLILERFRERIANQEIVLDPTAKPDQIMKDTPTDDD